MDTCYYLLLFRQKILIQYFCFLFHQKILRQFFARVLLLRLLFISFRLLFFYFAHYLDWTLRRMLVCLEWMFLVVIYLRIFSCILFILLVVFVCIWLFLPMVDRDINVNFLKLYCLLSRNLLRLFLILGLIGKLCFHFQFLIRKTFLIDKHFFVCLHSVYLYLKNFYFVAKNLNHQFTNHNYFQYLRIHQYLNYRESIYFLVDQLFLNPYLAFGLINYFLYI